jgi:NodT family efflux transporter outer membrane factor (OMF) lipoprotein
MNQDIQHTLAPRSHANKFRGTEPAVRIVLALSMLLAPGCMTGPMEYWRNGCKVGPDYCRPVADVNGSWLDSGNTQIDSAPANLAEWWGVFNDPALNQLVDIAYRQNLTVREAGFRVLEVRALRQIAVGNLFPQSQTLNGSYSRIQNSAQTGFGGGGGGGGIAIGPGRNFDLWQTGGSLAWELDFWGRFRRAIEAADAELDASVEQYDDVLVLLVSDVAQAYIDIRTLQQRLDYARQNVQSQDGSLRVATDLFEGGNTGKVDVTQAQQNLSTTEATIPIFELQLRQATNRLSVLLGQPPTDLSDILALSPAKIPQVPAQVVVGVPAELIRRRPDIRRAERLVAAQSARIGIAETDLYPAFTINGNLSVQAFSLSELFSSSATAGNIGPSFNWNVLNYGRIANNVRAHEARFQQLVAAYQNAVLEANREAEDAITSFIRTKEQTALLEESANAALESRDLIEALYRGGRTDFGRVFVAQATLVTQQDALAVAEGGVAQSLVDIYRSLGGGWQIRLANPRRLPAPLMVNAVAEPIIAPPPLVEPAVPAVPQ